jgi:hypothetical protein
MPDFPDFAGEGASFRIGNVMAASIGGAKEVHQFRTPAP